MLGLAMNFVYAAHAVPDVCTLFYKAEGTEGNPGFLAGSAEALTVDRY